MILGKAAGGGPGVGRPVLWKLAAAFAVVYLGYGLDFLAVKVGVETLPAFLFAGAHIFLAGLLIAGWRVARGRMQAPSMQTLRRAAIASFFLFVGGVGLVTKGKKLRVPSGVASIIKASVPLWVAVMESMRKGGEKPNVAMVVGLAVGAWVLLCWWCPGCPAVLQAGWVAPFCFCRQCVLPAALFLCGTGHRPHPPPKVSA